MNDPNNPRCCWTCGERQQWQECPHCYGDGRVEVWDAIYGDQRDCIHCAGNGGWFACPRSEEHAAKAAEGVT